MIVVQQLREYRKRLTHEQLELLLDKAESSKPLYLLTCCEELRYGILGCHLPSLALCINATLECCLGCRLQAQYGASGSGVDGKIRELPGEIPALMDIVLDRVERCAPQ
jgi:hypothetical protein